ncbi:MAG: nucleotidyltransferase family protein [Candidatus Aenigmatarchaeota archaeon]
MNEEIDNGLLKKLDNLVDGRTIKDRNQALSYLLKRHGTGKIRKAVVLCGGQGTRFRPITYEIPKALLPVHGKPIINHIFDLLKRHGITDISLSVGYLRERIIENFGDGSKLGLNIKYIEESVPMGTAGFLNLVSNEFKDTFIVSNGDELKDIDIDEMYKVHKQNNALITIALTNVSDPSAYGVARLDGNKILEFIEKPKPGDEPSNLINAGFYIVEPDIIEMLPKGHLMFEKDVFPMIAKMGKLYGYPFSGQWFDTGTPARYEIALNKWNDIKL